MLKKQIKNMALGCLMSVVTSYANSQLLPSSVTDALKTVQSTIDAVQDTADKVQQAADTVQQLGDAAQKTADAVKDSASDEKAD